MGFPTALVEQLWDSRTAFLILGYVVVAGLIRREKRAELYQLKAASTLVVGHLIAVVVAGALALIFADEITELLERPFNEAAWKKWLDREDQ